MKYLLDTNVISRMIREPHGPVARSIRERQSDVCTSIVVAAELRYGAVKKGSPGLAESVEAVLGALDVLPFASPADVEYGRLRAVLERAGRPIGPNDLIIAAQALCLDLVLVTDNEAEFRRVPDLRVENWLR